MCFCSHLSRVIEPGTAGQSPRGRAESRLRHLSGHPSSPASPALPSSRGCEVCLYFASLVLLKWRKGERQGKRHEEHAGPICEDGSGRVGRGCLEAEKYGKWAYLGVKPRPQPHAPGLEVTGPL